MSQEKLNLLSSILGMQLNELTPKYLRVTTQVLDELITHQFVDVEEESVKEVKEFLDSNPGFSPKIMFCLEEEPYVEVIGVVTHQIPEISELCDFVMLFRSHDEFHVSPIHCFCILD